MSAVSAETPTKLGFRMPAEWETHDATWMSWPRESGISFPDAYDRVIPVFIKMIEALSVSELVCLNVLDHYEEKHIAAMLPAATRGRVRYYPFRTNEPWCRDHGPTFLVNSAEKKLATVNWDYNAWGGKYAPYDDDNRIPQEISEMLDVPVFSPGIVLEGGAIDSNGSGTIMTTESCLLNPNRNPKLSRVQIEDKLKAFLGAKHILWLGDGIEGDDTDGHVDDLSRFVNRTTVVTVVESNEQDFNCTPLKENYQRLTGMTAEDGTRLKVIPMPMPRKMIREGQRLPASYANFYIGNSVVLLPTFRDPHDQIAVEILKEYLPDREILPIDCTELIWGLGAFHCLTQQQPRP